MQTSTTSPDWQSALNTARARRSANDVDGAVQAAREGLALQPGQPALVELLAQMLQGRPDTQAEALELWQGRLAAEPGATRARVEAAHLLTRFGRLREVEALLAEAEALEPGNLRWAEWRAGTIQRQPERLEEARNAWEAVVARFPDAVRGYQGLGLTLRALKRPKSARDVVEEGLRHCSGDPRLALLRAQLLDVLEPASEERIDAWTAVVAALPEEVAAQIGFCTALADFERIPEAEAAYGVAAAAFPQNERLPLGHAQLLTRLFRLDEALALCEGFLDRAERADSTVWHMTHVLSRLQRIDALERLLERPAARNLPNAAVLEQRVARLRAQFDASRARWNRARAQAPEQTVQAIAFRFADARDHGASQYGSLLALEEAPGELERLRLCQICFSTSGAEYGEAAGYFARRITELFPGDLRSHIDLAFSLMTPATIRSSEAVLRDILDRFPGQAEAALLLLGLVENSPRTGEYDALLQRITVAERGAFPRDFVTQCEVRVYARSVLRGGPVLAPERAIPSWPAIERRFPAAPLAMELIAAAIPAAPAVRREKPRVAICAAGQLRGYETAWPALIEKLAGPLEADLFLSTWDKVGTSHGAINSIARLVSPAFFEALPPVQRRASEFLATFRNTAALFSRDETVSAEALREQLGLTGVEVEDGDSFTARLEELGIDDRGRNPCRMVYRNWRCDALMREHVAHTGKPYDIVVRTRPDLLLNHIDLDAVRATAAQPDRVLAPRFRSVVLDDQFAVGHDSAMQIYAGIWPLVERNRGTWYMPNMGDVWSERLLRQHLLTFGVSISETRSLQKELCQRLPHWSDFTDALLEDISPAPATFADTLRALQADLDARAAASAAAEKPMIDDRRGRVVRLLDSP
ncbi:tetratricopeptide repeat protein [Roseomonas elaeocarpi]|uniref:Tetratricopeptide repeat protein n=1 Tax=Roseomonas elaeocarpi TaxID=907779 RepID=A0ABV6JT77_9PROT